MSGKKRTDFGGHEVPLIPEALYGMRSFNVRADGTLGPLHRATEEVYRQGVHTAECRLDGTWYMSAIRGTGQLGFVVPRNDLPVHNDPAPSIFCTCGFYAYFDEAPNATFMAKNQYQGVNAIVRATGRAIVGTMGFRAEKMEIVGLVCEYDEATLKERFMEFMLDFSAKALRVNLGFYACWWMIMYTLVVVGRATFGTPEWSNVLYQSLVLLGLSAVAVQIVSCGFAIFSLRKSIFQGEPLDHRPPRDLSNKIRTQYPDVLVFSDLESAKSHFKLTKATDIPS